jgi:Fe-S oxidoreductase
VRLITEVDKDTKSDRKIDDLDIYMDKIYKENLRDILKRCYQCGRCSGVCQLSKVEKFTPSKIIQLILEGLESKVLESGILWDCLSCNSCLQNCPEDINFADFVRIARYKMRKLAYQSVDDYIAHKGIYTTISEIMSKSNVQPKRSLDWVPGGCEISTQGNILYYVGCLPFFNFEFENSESIASSTLKILCQIENEPIVVFDDEICCGHDIYWGQGKLKAFIKLAQKNVLSFEKAGISKIITACAECYRTFKVDYPNLFDDFDEKFEVLHIIEYVYDNWKQNKIKFKGKNNNAERIQFTFHDPCRLSRFLPKENKILDKTREIFREFKKLGYDFNEMAHNKKNSLCCGVSSWMNCNEKSKALRYKRLLEAQEAGSIMITSCPKCSIHLSCLQKDYENLASVKILDFSEFLIDHIELISNKKEVGK